MTVAGVPVISSSECILFCRNWILEPLSPIAGKSKFVHETKKLKVKDGRAERSEGAVHSAGGAW